MHKVAGIMNSNSVTAPIHALAATSQRAPSGSKSEVYLAKHPNGSTHQLFVKNEDISVLNVGEKTL